MEVQTSGSLHTPLSRCLPPIARSFCSMADSGFLVLARWCGHEEADLEVTAFKVTPASPGAWPGGPQAHSVHPAWCHPIQELPQASIYYPL